MVPANTSRMREHAEFCALAYRLRVWEGKDSANHEEVLTRPYSAVATMGLIYTNSGICRFVRFHSNCATELCFSTPNSHIDFNPLTCCGAQPVPLC